MSGPENEVRPSDSRAESQAGLNGPGGSPPSGPDRVAAFSSDGMTPEERSELAEFFGPLPAVAATAGYATRTCPNCRKHRRCLACIHADGLTRPKP